MPAVPFIGHAGLFPPFANAAVLKLVEANEATTSTAIVPAMKSCHYIFSWHHSNSMATATIIIFLGKISYIIQPQRIFENLLSR